VGYSIMNTKPIKITAIILAFIAAALIPVAFYFFYWIKTPTYSLKIIKDSYRAHDLATFEKHVDLDSIFGEAFDVWVVTDLKIKGIEVGSDADSAIAMSFIQAFKPMTIETLKNHAISKVLDTPQTYSNAYERDRLKNWDKISGIDHSECIDASVLDTKDDTATIAIKIHNNQVDKDYQLNATMTKLPDGYWCVKEITNLSDYFLALDSAKKEKW
jgi:hypothetical protein